MSSTATTDYRSYTSSCPCSICNEREKCVIECKPFKKYVNGNSKLLRERNYNNFCELQKLSKNYGVK